MAYFVVLYIRKQFVAHKGRELKYKKERELQMIWKEGEEQQEQQQKAIGKELVETTREDERKGMVLLHGRYSSYIYAVAYRICRCRYIAENVVEDVMVRVQHAIFEHKHIKNPSGWLYTITRNATLDAVRKEKRQRSTPLLFEPQDTKNNVQEFIEKETFDWYLRNLSEIEYECIVRKVVNKETFQEIAWDKGKSLSSISTLYYRAVEKVKAEVEKSLGIVRTDLDGTPLY